LPRFAVVGHVEWIHFVRVAHLPKAGEIAHALEDWQEVGGGGAVAAVQLAKLAGQVDFFTALGQDEEGRRAHAQLQSLGVTVHCAWRDTGQRRAITFVDSLGERTITVMGPRNVATDQDALPWEILRHCQGCYYTGGPGQLARCSQTLVAASRVREMLGPIVPDCWVGSAADPSEIVEPRQWVPPARACVLTQGGRGGHCWTSEGDFSYAASAPPGPVVDAYGCGDSFAAALAYGLGMEYSLERALELAARCGAACLSGRGPYSGQLRLT